MTETTSPHVLIAGGGVAALETLIALRDLAGERVAITLLAPETDFTYRPMTVAQPFSLGHARAYGLAAIAKEFGAAFVQDSVAEVRADEKVVRCASGRDVAYDQLVVAVGAKATPSFPHAITFGEDPSEERLHGMLADLEQGYLQRVAFVVPAEATWTLPLYELAVMTARQAWTMGMDGVRFTLVTPEDRPLAMFGTPASEAVGELLHENAIEFVGSSYPSVGRGYVIADPGGRRIDADRIVALPALVGRAIEGVPADGDGFIPVDAHGRVRGMSGVYAAGDGTNFPIK
jgi:sulfide:quinone oxidoreductase